MKKQIFSLGIILIFFSSLSYSQQSNEDFYDYGWLKMMNNGDDFRTITEAANTAYADDSSRNKQNHYHHYTRWSNFWRKRIYSSPEDISNGKYGMFYHHSKAMNGLFRQEICNGVNHPASNWESWAFQTPPTYANGNTDKYGGMGIMWCVKIDTSDHNLQTIYAGSPLGGLYKTTDQGNNWVNLTDNTKLPYLNVSDIAIDPRNNQHLLISTGTYWSMSPVGIGILESYDGGVTWDSTAIYNNPVTRNSKYNYVDKVYFHPSDPTKYFMMIKNQLIMSTNNGGTWDDTLYSHPNSGAIFTRLSFHPANPDTMYLSSRDGDARIMRSFNGGNTWQNISNNFASGQHPLRFTEALTIPSQPDNVYAVIKEHFQTKDSNGRVISTDVRHRIYKSTDFGNTSSVMHSVSHYGWGNDFIASGKSIFEVSPQNDSFIMVGGRFPYHSSNQGVSFQGRSGDMHDDMRGAHFVDGLSAIAHDGGIVLSTDNGRTWQLKSDGLNVQQPFGHDVDKDYTYLLSPLQDVGFYRFDITNQSWTRLSVPGLGEGGVTLISDIDPTRAIGNGHCGVRHCNFATVKYSNSGRSSSRGRNLPVQAHSPEMRPFAQDHREAIYTGMEDVFKSTDYGSSWTKITDFDGTGVKHDTTNDHITAIATTPADTNLIVIGFLLQSYNHDDMKIPCPDSTSDCPAKKLFVSKDGGNTWLHRTKGVNGGQLPIEWVGISDVIVSPHDAGKIWVTMDGFRSIDKVYYTPDTGNTWINQTYDFPNFPIHSIVYQPNSNDRLYVSTDVGVYTKDASTTSWECYNNNLPAGMYVDLDVNNCGGALTASGHGRGIWKSPLAPNRLVGNIIWDDHREVGSDIIVQDTLTIRGTVEMAIGTKITVEVGGKLIINGGTITNSHCVDGLWQGIELLGNSNANQYGDPMSPNYPQGFVHIMNSATIENAETGIYAGSLSQNGQSGGRILIDTDNNQIKNCRNGVIIQSYARHSLNHFEGVSFINDGGLIDPTTNSPLITDTHVKIQGMTVIGNEFQGVSFINSQSNLAAASRGTGIHITGRRIGTTNNPLVNNCTFQDLNYGMRCGNLASGVGNDIENSDFIRNERAIYVAAGFSLEIKGNTFELPTNVGNDDAYAVMTTQLSQFDIRNNNIKGSTQAPSGTGRAMGIIIENSEGGGGVLFNNQIGQNKAMDICIQAQGNNENLTVRCNELDAEGDHPHGITVLDYLVTLNGQILANVPAQLRDQGHPNCLSQGQSPGDDKAAAGNKWLPSCSGNDEEILMSNGVVFKYYWHTLDVNSQLTTEPDCSDPNWNSNPNLYVNCGLNERNSSCDDLYTPPTDDWEDEGGEEGFGFFRKKNPNQKSGNDTLDIAAHGLWYHRVKAKKAELENRANGSSDESQLITSLQGNNGVASVMLQLKQASPLSKAVLLACIDEWAGVENTTLKEVLKANLPLEKSIWTRLHQKQLSALWMGEFGTANYTHPLRDSLERIDRTLRFAKKEWQLAEAKRYRELMADSSFKAGEQLLDSSYLSASLRLLAKDYIHRGEFSKGNTLLTRINSYDADGELDQNRQYVAYYTALLPFYIQGKSTLESELEAEALRPIMKLNHNLGGEAEVFYENLTQQFGHHPIVRKQATPFQEEIPLHLSKDLKRFKLYPNPNSGMATLDYHLAGENAALWQVFDINGKLLHELTLPTGEQQKQVNTKGLPSGVYHFVVSLKEERLFNGKMIVVKEK